MIWISVGVGWFLVSGLVIWSLMRAASHADRAMQEGLCPYYPGQVCMGCLKNRACRVEVSESNGL